MYRPGRRKQHLQAMALVTVSTQLGKRLRAAIFLDFQLEDPSNVL